jgi:hypothetical protein
MLDLGLWGPYNLVEYEMLVCATSCLGLDSVVAFVVVVA